MLHANNGDVMLAATLERNLEELGVLRFYCSLQVSKDNHGPQISVQDGEITTGDPKRPSRQQGYRLSMDGVIYRLEQRLASPERDQIRNASLTSKCPSRRNVSTPGCRLRTSTPMASTPKGTIDAVLASTGSGMEQPTTSTNRRQNRYIDHVRMVAREHISF